jgi:hypothetical protein
MLRLTKKPDHNKEVLMKRSLLPFLWLLLLTGFLTSSADSQTRWMVGGRLGMSLYTVSSSAPNYYYYYYGSSTSTSTTSAGLQIGPMGEVIFNKQMAIGTEFNINTQGGTPIQWASYFKYYFAISGSTIKPYADAGFSLFFVTGGPYFGIQAGGGAMFEIAKNVYIPADLELGPVFLSGTTGFYLAVTSGIRYVIPN